MRTELLTSLPQPFSRDILGIPTLLLSASGDCWIEIEDGVLRTSVTTGTAPDLYLDLRDYSLTALVAYLNTVPGYLATIHSEFTTFRQQQGLAEAHFGAWALADTRQQLDHTPALMIANNVLLQLLGGIGMEMITTRAKIDGITRNVNLNHTTAAWLDDWGELYGIPRERQADTTLEPDAVYRRRIILELIHPRATNYGIRQIVRARWPVRDVTIEDDMRVDPEDQARFEAGLPWRRLNPYNFLAVIELSALGGFTDRLDGLIDLVTRIKPWGTSFEPSVRAVTDEGPVLTRIHDERWDTLTTDEHYDLRKIIEESLMRITDIHNEPLLRQETLLLTIRPTGRASRWNALDNNNSDRTTIRHDAASSLATLDYTIGTGRHLLSWVNTITEQWYDVTVYPLPDDTVPRAVDGDTWSDIYVSDDHYPLTRIIEEHPADAVGTVCDEPVVARLWYWRANNAFSRTQSRFARANAHPPADNRMIAWTADFSQDFRDGVWFTVARSL